MSNMATFYQFLNGCTLQKRCEYGLVTTVLLIEIKKKNVCRTWQHFTSF